MVKAILFDWHGVLDTVTFSRFLDYSTQRWHDFLAESYGGRSTVALSYQRLKAITYHYLEQEGRDYARGIMSAHDFWRKCREDIYVPEQTHREIQSFLLSINLNEDLWELVPHLARAYKLALVSDMPSDKAYLVSRRIAEQQRYIPVRDTPLVANLASSAGNQVNHNGMLFDPIVFSYAHGRLKVEEGLPSLFRYAADELGLHPHECLVVDDSERNVEHAVREGFDTLHYVGRPSALELMALLD